MLVEEWLRRLREEKSGLENFILTSNFDDLLLYKKTLGKLEGVNRSIQIYKEITARIEK